MLEHISSDGELVQTMPRVMKNIEIINKDSIISKLKHLLKYIGPAFIVSVAYIDPGNIYME